MKKIALLGLILIFFNCNGSAQQNEPKNETYKITKTDTEWKAQLSEIEYNVLRRAGTEPRYSSPFMNYKEKGTYV